MSQSQAHSATLSPAPDATLSLGVSVLVLWFTFGLATLLNALALRLIYDGAALPDPAMPTQLQQSAWLVLGFWLSGYCISLVVGLWVPRWPRPALILSASSGYLLAVLARLVVLGAFPRGPQDPFSDVWRALTLQGMSSQLGVLLLSLAVGPLFIWLAVVSGQLLGRELSQRLPALVCDPPVALGAGLLPVAYLITAWGLAILLDPTARADLEQSAFVPVGLAYLDDFMSPTVHLIISLMVGLTVGLNPRIEAWPRLTLSTAGGMMAYALFVLLSVDLWALYAPAGTALPLDLLNPSLVNFGLVWLGTVGIAAGVVATLGMWRANLAAQPGEPSA